MVNSQLSGDPMGPLQFEHAFYRSIEELITSDGAGDVRRMLEYAGPKLAQSTSPTATTTGPTSATATSSNPLGLDARIRQRNEFGDSEVDWEALFGTLRDMDFDGIGTVCVVGWEEKADDIHRRMLERVRADSDLLITRP